METHYFTYGQLMNILDELDEIADKSTFTKRIFSIIHHEVMKVSYLKVHQPISDESYGNNIFILGIEQAKLDAKNKLVRFCYSLKGTDELAQPLLDKVADNKRCLEEIKTQCSELHFWQFEMRYYYWKVKKHILEEHVSFKDVCNLFMNLYLKRGIGNALSFHYDLIGYSRHVGKKKEKKEKQKGPKFKNPFRKTPVTISAATRTL